MRAEAKSESHSKGNLSNAGCNLSQAEAVEEATFGTIHPINVNPNPLKEVPVLEFSDKSSGEGSVEGGVHRLTQSLAIIEFLDEIYPLGTAEDQLVISVFIYVYI